MTPEESAERPEIPYLQGWHRAKERASRFNRNLQQYAAAIAALLGIGGGTGAVTAVAVSITSRDADSPESWVVGVGIAAAILVGLIVLALIYYLVRAFRLRLKAEVDANNFKDELIKIAPERFWPPPPDQG